MVCASAPLILQLRTTHRLSLRDQFELCGYFARLCTTLCDCCPGASDDSQSRKSHFHYPFGRDISLGPRPVRLFFLLSEKVSTTLMQFNWFSLSTMTPSIGSGNVSIWVKVFSFPVSHWIIKKTKHLQFSY